MSFLNPDFSQVSKDFVAPAREKLSWWRVLLTILTTGLIWSGCIMLAFLALEDGFPQDETSARGVLTTPSGMIVLLISFAGLFFGLLLAARIWHARKPIELFGTGFRRGLRNFAISIAALTLLYAVSALIFSYEAPLTTNLEWSTWLLWLPAFLPLLLLQISAEELFFRGYLQQIMGAVSSNRLIWAFLPSALFGLMHYDADNFGPNAMLVVLVTTLYGLLLAELTMYTGNLGAALGLHFANNFYAMGVVAPDGDMTGLALYLSPIAISDIEGMREELLFAAFFAGIALAVFYFWTHKQRS